MQASDELARARLAYVSAGQAPLSAPRRALHEPELDAEPDPDPDPVPGPAPDLPSRLDGALSHPRPLTRKHLVILAILVLCGVGVAVAAMGRSAATEVPVVAPVVDSPPSPTPSPVPRVRVHVAGAVAAPGVVSLPVGAIVEEAIVAAGGLAPDANPAGLNLAQPLADGMQIMIGTDAEPVGEVSGAGHPSGGGGAPGGQLNLNSASAGELESLPGVGPVMAGAIVAWREEHGRFTSVEELQEVSGIGPKTFDKLRPLVAVS
ncbi:MAG TPA: ComEA family DNA-binding protein [Tessaracoccus flavescens]|uniref:ComEA family DNA-binding protein n=1 Tax=Tessaracoccus flavescens TaxID=399497 RepID=A0A921JQQ9_9ACTN|nr:ComEA family DNA-binding protein [Tessaracoccus flavescens]